MQRFLAKAVPDLVVFLSGLAIMVLELVASRLVARHLGSSLDTWTGVIGVVLAGMSLGNYWGGRLSDRLRPERTLPVLFWASALLCLSVLWTNDWFGGSLVLARLPGWSRTAAVILLVFFAPACALGTIPPTVARWALDKFAGPGVALGNVYAWGTIGNILGTLLTGFVLLARFGLTGIVQTVAATLAVTGVAVLVWNWRKQPVRSGRAERRAESPNAGPAGSGAAEPGFWFRALPNTFVFASGLAIMALELAGSRVLARHTGSSIYTWTSLIAVVLAGIAVGNYVGGLLADWFRPGRTLPYLFLVSSVLIGLILWTGKWLGFGPTWWSWVAELPLPQRVLLTVAMVFFVPCCALGTISPVTAKFALERGRRAGVAIGNVYAWGSIGSILGTFVTGYLLISLLGYQAVLCLLAAVLAFIAVAIPVSGIVHSVWAGVTLTGCLVVMAPDSWQWAARVGQMVGIREVVGPETYLRQSNYYTIKVKPSDEYEGATELVLDNLVHGYVFKGNPRKLQYGYESIYASIMERAGAIPAVGVGSEAEASGRPAGSSQAAGGTASSAGGRHESAGPAGGHASSTGRPLRALFLGGGSYTFPRYLLASYPGSYALVMEIDPAVTRAAHEALFLPRDTPIVTRWGDAGSSIDRMLREQRGRPVQFDFVFGDAFNDFSVPWHLTTREFNDKVARLLAPNGVYMMNIIDNYKYAKFLGAFVLTARKTFPCVEVFCTSEEAEPPEQRETFVVAMSHKRIDYGGLGSRPGEREFKGLHLTPKQVQEAIRRAGSIVLTNDYAPVENLLAPVARERG